MRINGISCCSKINMQNSNQKQNISFGLLGSEKNAIAARDGKPYTPDLKAAEKVKQELGKILDTFEYRWDRKCNGLKEDKMEPAIPHLESHPYVFLYPDKNGSVSGMHTKAAETSPEKYTYTKWFYEEGCYKNLTNSEQLKSFLHQLSYTNGDERDRGKPPEWKPGLVSDLSASERFQEGYDY